jgi:hypothetical protein
LYVRLHTDHRAHDCCLAAAARAEQPADDARLDREVQAMKDLASPTGDAQVFHLDR